MLLIVGSHETGRSTPGQVSSSCSNYKLDFQWEIEGIAEEITKKQQSVDLSLNTCHAVSWTKDSTKEKDSGTIHLVGGRELYETLIQITTVKGRKE